MGVTSHTRKSKRAKEATSRVMLVVKLSNESMPQKFFATAQPSMLRRLYFRWVETVPGLKHEKYIENYGYVGNFSQTDLKKLGLENYKICNLQDFINLNKEEILAKLRKL